jgi:hypothetical protein
LTRATPGGFPFNQISGILRVIQKTSTRSRKIGRNSNVSGSNTASSGYSRSSVAEILGVTRRTIYNYEKRVVFKENTRHGRPAGKSKLTPFYFQIDTALEKDFNIK